MKIVADQEIFAVEQVFSPLGELKLLPGRNISRQDLVDADALLVRSVLSVDGPLLDGTRVKFVGTATSGTDHLALEWLREAGIRPAHTRGANANAVVEYCLGALAWLMLKQRTDLSSCSIGIIGAGEIGGRLARRMKAMGCAVVVCDPPLAEATLAKPDFDFQPMEAALDCDIISLHVPLTFHGRHATAGLLDGAALNRVRSGAVLLHACRGGVVDEADLLARLSGGAKLHCVIDVWENEPQVNPALAMKASLATPHIAGYSEQAKWAATQALARQLAEHFDLPGVATADAHGSGTTLTVPRQWTENDLAPWRIVDQCVQLEDMSVTLKSWAGGIGADSDRDQLAKEFDQMRKRFLRRQEFSVINLMGLEELQTPQRNLLQQAGFRL